MHETLQRRSSGVLLHVTSLPGGRLGDAAFRFIDWLHAAGQTWWQILPLGPPDKYGSPYVGMSAFAAWPGLLAEPDAEVDPAERERFRERNAYWIDDWERFAGPGAVDDQVRFEREWTALLEHAHERGVRILGDMALYVAPKGADRRFRSELFQREGAAGCPPDYYSDDGQLWGNPLYDWRAMRADGFRWWVERVRRSLDLADAVRIDHFRGIVAYWSIPSRARTARHGRWRRGPGRALFDAIRERLGDVALVAEDLGVITPAVDRLRREVGMPGMVVLQFELGAGPAQAGRLWHDEDRVAYPGTHDNATMAEWFDAASDLERRHLRDSLAAEAIDEPDPSWGAVRLAHAAPARIAIASAQDLLGLGAESRMNLPSRRRGNWAWRLTQGQLTPRLAERLREVTREAGRLPPGRASRS